jgi:hypothetical protein
MTLRDFLNQSGNTQEYSNRSKILLFAYFLRQHKGVLEFGTPEMRACFREAMLKAPSNLSTLLKEMKRGRNSALMASGGAEKYALSMPGLTEVEAYLGAKQESLNEVDSFLQSAIPYLEKLLGKVADSSQKNFLAESIACLGVDAKRATILMTWAGVIAHLYDYIIASSDRLAAFNLALSKRSDKYGKLTITAYDDFTDIPESVFIEVCRSAKIISNDVRKILDEKLGIRNTCAHPSGVEVHRTKVINFIEDLVDNVIIKYNLA